MAESADKPMVDIDEKRIGLNRCLERGACEAEGAKASSSSSSANSFQLMVKKINLCLDRINRECFDFSSFFRSCIQFFLSAMTAIIPFK